MNDVLVLLVGSIASVVIVIGGLAASSLSVWAVTWGVRKFKRAVGVSSDFKDNIKMSENMGYSDSGGGFDGLRIVRNEFDEFGVISEKTGAAVFGLSFEDVGVLSSGFGGDRFIDAQITIQSEGFELYDTFEHADGSQDNVYFNHETHEYMIVNGVDGEAMRTQSKEEVLLNVGYDREDSGEGELASSGAWSEVPFYVDDETYSGGVPA